MSDARGPEPSTTHLVLIPTYNAGAKVLETVREALQRLDLALAGRAL